MYRTDDLEIWNLDHGATVVRSAQAVFNVVGRVLDPAGADPLSYSLNGSPERPVFVARSALDCERLERPGDFNIDTIDADRLSENNRLTLRLGPPGATGRLHHLEFACRPATVGRSFRLALSGVRHPHEVGQIVDGRWRVARDERGEMCLEVCREDAGYDRIIVFGSREGNGLEVTARLSVTAWTGALDHGIGLAFRWNPHRQGDGTTLPSEWTTGIGFYYLPADVPSFFQRFPGARLRIVAGRDVHRTPEGEFRGQRIVKQPIAALVRWALTSSLRKAAKLQLPATQIGGGGQFRVRVSVRRKGASLSMWPADDAEPAPQIETGDLLSELPDGSVGVIAHHCAVRVYELDVRPL